MLLLCNAIYLASLLLAEVLTSTGSKAANEYAQHVHEWVNYNVGSTQSQGIPYPLFGAQGLAGMRVLQLCARSGLPSFVALRGGATCVIASTFEVRDPTSVTTVHGVDRRGRQGFGDSSGHDGYGQVVGPGCARTLLGLALAAGDCDGDAPTPHTPNKQILRSLISSSVNFRLPGLAHTLLYSAQRLI